MRCLNKTTGSVERIIRHFAGHEPIAYCPSSSPLTSYTVEGDVTYQNTITTGPLLSSAKYSSPIRFSSDSNHKSTAFDPTEKPGCRPPPPGSVRVAPSGLDLEVQGARAWSEAAKHREAGTRTRVLGFSNKSW